MGLVVGVRHRTARTGVVDSPLNPFYCTAFEQFSPSIIACKFPLYTMHFGPMCSTNPIQRAWQVSREMNVPPQLLVFRSSPTSCTYQVPGTTALPVAQATLLRLNSVSAMLRTSVSNEGLSLQPKVWCCCSYLPTDMYIYICIFIRIPKIFTERTIYSLGKILRFQQFVRGCISWLRHTSHLSEVSSHACVLHGAKNNNK